MDKAEMIERVIAIVQERAAAAEPGDVRGEYVEAYHVANILTGEGVLTHPEQGATQQSAKDRVERSLHGKAKRLLDEAAEQGRILRFSSHDHQTVPTLDGTRRSFYGSAVYYTTPEAHARAEAAVVARDAAQNAERDAFRTLVERARAAGLPDGAKVEGLTISFGGLDNVRSLVEILEGAAT